MHSHVSEIVTRNISEQQQSLLAALRKACKKIAPVWPLENFVAVNPYLGLADHPFNSAAELLTQAGGIQMTLPVSFYLEALEQGRIQPVDVREALFKNDPAAHQKAAEFIQSVHSIKDSGKPQAGVSTVADVITEVSGKDWGRFVTDRISAWAATYFDNGQALWATANQKTNLYAAWKEEAQVDRTPAIMGLSGFNKLVKSLPEVPIDGARFALEQLHVPQEGLALYLHRLLLRVGGWSAYAARIDWDNELYGGKDGALIELLCVLLCWEACLLECLDDYKVKEQWKEARMELTVQSSGSQSNHLLAQKLMLQQAFDRAAQRSLIEKFANQPRDKPVYKPQTTVQAIFCIDVRSEVFRRNLELVAPKVATLGFAGFFAFPINYIPLGHEQGNAQCPVLLPTGPVILEEIPEPLLHKRAIQSRRLRHHVRRAWKSFKLGAISCFSFVGPVGLLYLPKLFTDSFGLTRPVPHPESEGIKPGLFEQRTVSLEVGRHKHETVGIPLNEQIQLAKSALQAMSLTEDFARLVLMVGHGSTTVNNPYATGLDCGACGGHTGEANARVAAAVLNEAAVRNGLEGEGITIPEHTYFIACQHDTTTDEVTLFNEREIPPSHQEEVAELRQRLREAGHAARTERALRMDIDTTGDLDALIKARSKDWAQVRPEWGLAGCSAFVVAPRHRTQGINLDGRSFLHSYEWKKDRGFKVLELIMTAPMVVTSWISLQYYASTVDNQYFGSGNKTLHNVTGGIGVLEGYAGDLRTGLPWQSVHDGKQYQHEPLILNVVIEAPLEVMNLILKKHESVRQLCDNGWIHLLAMDEQGQVSHRYTGEFEWEAVGK